MCLYIHFCVYINLHKCTNRLLSIIMIYNSNKISWELLDFRCKLCNSKCHRLLNRPKLSEKVKQCKLKWAHIKSTRQNITSLCSTLANTQLNVNFLTNKKKGQNLALHVYIYRVNLMGPDRVFWRCTIPECSATVSTENNIPAGFGRRQHNHRADHTQIVAKQSMNLMTKQCAKEVNQYHPSTQQATGQRMGRYQQRSSWTPTHIQLREIIFIQITP